MKRFLYFQILVAVFCLLPLTSYGADNYYIDNKHVLLYKLINWWYHCPPEECDSICGKKIKCISDQVIGIEYQKKQSVLKLSINGNFADLLIPFKQNDNSFGPAIFKCKTLNKRYFGSAKADDYTNCLTPPCEFKFESVWPSSFKALKKIESRLAIVIEGVVAGLLNDKIVLYRAAGENIEYCKDVKAKIDSDGNYPISISIIDSGTNVLLAEYLAVWK